MRRDKITYPLNTRLNVLLGLQVEEAVRLIEGEGLIWRIVSFDGHPRVHEKSQQLADRVNLGLQAGKVVEALVY